MDTKISASVEEIIKQVEKKTAEFSPEEAAKFVMELDNRLYLIQGAASIRHGNGIHSKHRHINYHKFFTDNIESGENVLDIGSSTGELVNDIADKANPGQVYGVEILENHYEKAKQTYHKPNLHFLLGDATKIDLPDVSFDVMTLSNVLEHIEHRPEFLKALKDKYQPKRFLIRVPMFERDWRVPFKKELGLDYRLDDTHFIEYSKEIFEEEIKQAGLQIDKLDIRWGEIWAVLKSI